MRGGVGSSEMDSTSVSAGRRGGTVLWRGTMQAAAVERCLLLAVRCRSGLQLLDLVIEAQISCSTQLTSHHPSALHAQPVLLLNLT